MANRMILNETAWFGRGAINALTDEAVRRGYRKALIVTDSTLARSQLIVGPVYEDELAPVLRIAEQGWHGIYSAT